MSKDRSKRNTPEKRHAAWQKGQNKRAQQKAAWQDRTRRGAKRDAEQEARAAGSPPDTPLEALPVGTILTRARSGILVQDDAKELHWCRVPGKGKLLKTPVPGDRVRFTPQSDTSDGWIEGIEERSTLFHRYVFGRIKEIAANMDRVFILATPHDPLVSPRLVDRMLVGAEVGLLDAWIVLNKLDLFTTQELDEYAGSWERAGYPVLRVSAETGAGLDRLFAELKGHASLLAGASGVGKSTLLNRLIEDLDLDTSTISEATGRGVHTTTATRLFPVPGGGTVADTPGVREFYPVIEDPAELQLYFPDFEETRDECDYEDCLHIEKSSGCAVRKAVEAGEIAPRRYESYLLLYQSLLEGPMRGRALTQG